MNYIGGRHDRVLSIYSNLMDGRAVNVKTAAEHYGVSTRTIKRDIDDIRSFLFEQGSKNGVYKEVLYDRAKDNYYLTGADKLSSRELFALCKVLLESCSLCARFCLRAERFVKVSLTLCLTKLPNVVQMTMI